MGTTRPQRFPTPVRCPAQLAKERSFRVTSLTERLGLAFARERENPYFRFMRRVVRRAECPASAAQSCASRRKVRKRGPSPAC